MMLLREDDSTQIIKKLSKVTVPDITLVIVMLKPKLLIVHEETFLIIQF